MGNVVYNFFFNQTVVLKRLLNFSFISAITVLGIPAEIYRYGVMYMWFLVAFVPAVLGAMAIYVPVFYNLNLTSSFEVRTYCIHVVG